MAEHPSKRTIAREYFCACLDDVDSYVQLRAQGIIDQSLLWTKEEMKEVIGKKQYRKEARSNVRTVKYIERCIERKHYKRAKKSLPEILRPKTAKLLLAILEYELRNGDRPWKEQVAEESDSSSLQPEESTDAPYTSIAEEQDPQRKILREKLEGDDISDVINRLLEIAKEERWFITRKKGRPGTRISTGVLRIVVLCLRAGVGASIVPENHQTQQFRISWRELQSNAFTYGLWEIAGEPQTGIMLKQKDAMQKTVEL